MFVHRLIPWFPLSLIFCACSSTTDGSPPPAPTLAFPLAVAAQSESKNPVSGVEISLGQQLLATTDASGNARLTLHGQEGDSRALNVKCPAAYASPERPLLVGLRQLGNGATRARFEVECFTLVHSVVVGVRAENGPRLPILHLNNVVGQTDEQGVAHVLLHASANEQLALTLDTSKNPNLLPQNPTLDFSTKDSDEFWLVTQKFTVKQAPPRHFAPRPVPTHL